LINRIENLLRVVLLVILSMGLCYSSKGKEGEEHPRYQNLRQTVTERRTSPNEPNTQVKNRRM
jgi:hypothetical protein